MMQLVDEAKAWYRSAMVWFLGLAGMMEVVSQALPQVQGYLPDGWYGYIQVACVVVGAGARFIKQNGMARAVEAKKAKA